jgi:hypothetical protein
LASQKRRRPDEHAFSAHEALSASSLGDRGDLRCIGKNDLFGFLTTESNAEVSISQQYRRAIVLGVTTMTVDVINRYQSVLDEIGDLNWPSMTRDELMAVSTAYYYFSVQFVEAVHVACKLYPSDPQLIELRQGECDTDNLSPYPRVAKPGEKMNHDEFMRRTVAMSSLDGDVRNRVESLGRAYLAEIHQFDPITRAMSLSTYEDGGLETVFRAILSAPDWTEPSLGAFRHFLVEHIKLDSGEHGGLCRHLVADDRILPLWNAFRDLLVGAAPRLAA